MIDAYANSLTPAYVRKILFSPVISPEGGGRNFLVFFSLVRVTITWELFSILENRLQVRKLLGASLAFYSPLLLEMVICKSCLFRNAL